MQTTHNSLLMKWSHIHTYNQPDKSVSNFINNVSPKTVVSLLFMSCPWILLIMHSPCTAPLYWTFHWPPQFSFWHHRRDGRRESTTKTTRWWEPPAHTPAPGYACWPMISASETCKLPSAVMAWFQSNIHSQLETEMQQIKSDLTVINQI